MMTVPVGDGDAGGEESPPRSPKLRPTFLVVLFAVRMIVMNPVAPSLSQIEAMVKRIVDCTIGKYHDMISRKLESVDEKIEGLRDEMRELAHQRSNSQADRDPRLEPIQAEQATSNNNLSNTNVRLGFLNGLRPPTYTDKNLTAENNAPIKVAIFEGDNVISSGPLSRVKVEILILRGDFSSNRRDGWTEEEFEKHIVQGRDGQGVVLGDDRTAWLTNGQVELSQIRFKEGSCRTPSRKFIMAARVCKSEMAPLRIQEAIMNPVVVLDRRNQGNEKSHPPRLYDDLYRLEEISRGGAYHTRLLEAKISTVQELLKALNKDSDGLCKILRIKKTQKSWSKMIGHARECILEDEQELKRYQNEKGDVVLFFNCVHDLIGAAFPHDYVACQGFDVDQKASVKKCKEQAYSKLDGITPGYIMKDNIPRPISSGTDAAAGPSSAPVAGASQPNFSADPLEEFQGTGAADIPSLDDIFYHHDTGPFYSNANNHHMITVPDDLRTYGYQGEGTPLTSTVLESQRISTGGPIETPYTAVELRKKVTATCPSCSLCLLLSGRFVHIQGIQELSVSNSSISAHGCAFGFLQYGSVYMFQEPSTFHELNSEPHDLSHLHQLMPEDEQGPSFSDFPGSGRGTDFH